MSSAANVEVRLKIVDQGVNAGLKGVAQAAEKASSKSVAAAKTAASQSVKAATDAASQSVRAVQAQHDHHVKLYKDMSVARERLGIRSEQVVRDEIAKTKRAYQTLATSGALSAREVGRAYDAQLTKVKALRRELGEVGKLSRIMPGAVTAVAGAAMLVKPKVAQAMGYDHSVAQITNTLYSDRDAAGRIAGKSEVKAAISEALKNGGDRDQAAATLNNLLSSGEFSKASSFKLLGTIQKASTGTGADSNDLAAVALAAKRSGVSEDQIPEAISKAIRAGQLGGFELSDMAKHLPAALASASSLGITGMSGFERVLTAMQASVTTAGTKDEAANNLINILEKVNTEDTAKDFKKQGIDLRAELAKGAGRGEDTLTTFTSLIDSVIAKDPKTKAATQELDRLSKIAEDKKNPGREQALKAMQSIYESADIGKILQDRQALQGFRAERLSKQAAPGEESLSQRVGAGIKADKGQELETSYAVMNDTASVQMQRLANANLEGQDKMLTSAGGPMKDLFQGAVSVAEQFPILTASASMAAAALGLVAASAGINAVLGGKSGGAGLLSKAGNAVSNVANKVPMTVPKGAGWFGLAAGVGGAALASAAGEDSKAARYGSAALSGAGLGATIGSIVPGVGTGVGALLGGAGGMAIQGVSDLFSHPAIQPVEPQKVDATANLNVNLAPGLVLQQQNTQTNGMNMNTKVGGTGNLFTGAP